MKSIAIEGIPGSGKTTLAKSLDRFLGASVHTLDEHILPENDLNEFSKDNPNKEDTYRLNWTIKNTLVSMYSYKKYVVSDRYFITAIAYAYSLDKGNPRGSKYLDAVNWARKSIASGELRIPDLCIVLLVKHDLSNQRKGRRETQDMLWSQNEALDYADQFYREVLPNLGFYKQLTYIETTDRDYEEVLQRAKATILP